MSCPYTVIDQMRQTGTLLPDEMSEPIQRCQLCGRVQTVRPDGRGFPPRIAARKLLRACNAAGCPCEPHYQAGISADLMAAMRNSLGMGKDPDA